MAIRRGILSARPVLPFVPTQVPGLKLFYGSDPGFFSDTGRTTLSTDGGAIAAAADGSGTGAHLTQATGGNQPVYRATGFRGQPCIEISGTQFLENLVADPVAGAAQAALFIVHESTAFPTATMFDMGANQMQVAMSPTQFLPSITNGKQATTGWLRSQGLWEMYYDGSLAVASRLFDADWNGRKRALTSTSGSFPATLPSGAGITLGRSAAGAANWAGKIALVLLYTGSAVFAAAGQIRDWIMNRWFRPMNRLAIFDGNSLTAGSGSTGGQTYPVQTAALLGSGWDTVNVGVGGQSTAGMNTRAGQFVDAAENAWRSGEIVVGWEGTNDLFLGATPATSISRLTTYYSGRKAEGYRVVVMTVLPRSSVGVSGTFEADRQTINASLRANWPTYADALVDVAADPRIGDQGDETDTTYYADLTHLNNTGYGVVASLVAPVLKALA